MQERLIKTIEENSQAEIVEKKSKFIANLYHINSKKEAEEIINKTKSKYKDARHNCFAFSVYEGEQKYTKSSDDGEPSGTAGIPILNVIEKNKLTNILIIVTRYFGGILLGTGGLTRAYSGAALAAIKNSKIITEQMGILVEVELDYQNSEDFKFYCNYNKINIDKIEYKENVLITIEISENLFDNLFNIKSEKQIIKSFNIISYVEICRKYVKKEE